MHWRSWLADLWWRVWWALARWRRGLRLLWYHAGMAPWVFALSALLVVALLGYGLSSVIAYHGDLRSRAREFHRKSLACLARNVYFEARGEPVAGQYAVAEVTMNRRASRRYPDTVCEVVYQQNWDTLRGRYVGAFSWTEFDGLPEPSGEEWRRAVAIAEAVYYQRYTPVLQGAMHYHAAHIKPEWARQQQRVAKIGRHIFYK
jgi:N-acetylmuramoyl-L-alanine amidase